MISAVIEFPMNRVRPPGEARSDHSAHVVIFPGVRVERLMYDLAERLPAARNAPAPALREAEFDFY